MLRYLGYRDQRAGADGGGVYTFSGGFAESQERQAENARHQQRKNEAYIRRVQEFGIVFYTVHFNYLISLPQNVNRK